MNPDHIPVTDLAVLIRSMDPVLNDGVYVFATVPHGTAPVTGAVATFRETESLTVVVPEAVAQESGLDILFRARWITLQVYSALDAVGLTAAVADALTKKSISCNVIAAGHHDHIFVPVEDAMTAMDALKKLAVSYSD